MAFFQVDRSQYPIGQGGFHSAVVHTSANRRLSMVVDCGGADAEHRGVLISAFAERHSPHDILAISHFDDDHINGIEELHGAGVRFNSVFLPHVEVKDYLLWMTLRFSVEDRNSYELSRLVQLGGRLYGGDFGPVVLVGSTGSTPSDDSRRGDSADDNLAELLTKDAYDAVMKARGVGGRNFPCSQSLTFKNIDWLVRFYSREWKYPAEVQTIWSLPLFANLKAIVDRTTKPMAPADWASFATDLEFQLSAKIKPGDAAQVKKILGAKPSKADPRLKSVQKLVREIQSKPNGLSCKNVLSQLYLLSHSLKDYNDASMCIYSGPAQRGVGTRRERFTRLVHFGRRALSEHKLKDAPSREVGWITTGDADFSTPTKLKDFLSHFHCEIGLTTVFVLPHHGSRMSYDSNLDRLRELIAHLCDRPLFIAPANPEHKKYQHPHWQVESTCRRFGDFYVVDQGFASSYAESLRVVRNLTGLMILDSE